MISIFLHVSLVSGDVEVVPASLVEFVDDIGFGSRLSFFCLLEGFDSFGASDSSDDIHNQFFVRNFVELFGLSEFLSHSYETVDIKVLVLFCLADD